MTRAGIRLLERIMSRREANGEFELNTPDADTVFHGRTNDQDLTS